MRSMRHRAKEIQRAAEAKEGRNLKDMGKGMRGVVRNEHEGLCKP